MPIATNPVVVALRTFSNDIIRSCYDMEFYRVVRTRPLAEAFKYLGRVGLLVAIAAALVLAPASTAALHGARDFVRVRVPDEASFTVKDGKFTTTAATPLELGTGKSPFTIDPSVTGTEFPPAFAKDGGILVGSDAMFIQGDDGSKRVYPFIDSPEFSVTKPQIEKWLGRFGTVTIIGVVLLLSAFVFAMTFVGGAIYAAFAALLMFAATRIWKVRIGYRQLLAMSLHALTLPGALRILIPSLYAALPVAFTVVYFMILVTATADERARPTSPPPPEQAPAA
jgi:hypothetical protein